MTTAKVGNNNVTTAKIALKEITTLTPMVIAGAKQPLVGKYWNRFSWFRWLKWGRWYESA